MDALNAQFPLLPAQTGVKFCAANGTPIQNYGRRQVLFKAKGKHGVNGLQFHVTDVKKPLASVSCIVQNGSTVRFSPEESYIKSASGERIELRLESGVYVMDVEYCSGFTRPAQ